MKCPVSMLPRVGSSTASILFVIGVIATISYALHAQQNKAKANKNG
ncbi:hypothetical protein [Methylotenera versatilis]|uniref:Uncharacterized protein n=1 Tax=Methylotenera versatilis (strain 301) TaxID=666681 RepID=D7DKD7_METV0|nr:hypothetical protein [Methylotenera versatilis]ADI28522.1 hypothetical protein M301_0134 [Methylotenera versatilis 301]